MLGQYKVMPQNGKDFIQLGYYLYFYNDSAKKIDVNGAIENVQESNFKLFNSNKVFNIGYSKSKYWFYVVVKNTSLHKLELLYSIYDDLKYCRLYEIDFREGNGNEAKNASYSFKAHPELNYTIPFESRPFPVRSLSYLLNFKKDEIKHLLIEVDNSPQNLYTPMDICTLPDYLLWEVNYQRKYGYYLGIFIIAFIFSFIFFLRIKKILFFWYCLYIFSWFFILLQEEFFTGYVFTGSAYTLFAVLWQIIFVALASSCSIKITLALSRLSSSHNLHKLAIGGFYVLIIFFVITLFTCLLNSYYAGKVYEYYFSKIGYALALIIQLLLIIILIRQSLNNNKQAFYYLIGLLIFLAGCLNVYLNILGVTNFTFIEPNGVTVGLTIEIVVIGLLIANFYYENLLRLQQNEINLSIEKLEMSEQIISTLDEERIRIGQDLHDDLGATLSLIKLRVDNNPLDKVETSSLLSKAITDLRNISHNLLNINLQNKGLKDSITSFIEQVAQNNTVKFEYSFVGEEEKVSYTIKLNLFLIITELINNVIKHSGASTACISIYFDDSTIDVIVEDNGIGFNIDLEKSGSGLKNIRARVKILNGVFYKDANVKGSTFIIQIKMGHEGKQN